MAKAIATVSGIGLVPGVSKNGRLYTREAIARAVSRAQRRLEAGESLDIVRRDRAPAMAGDEPMSQLTHHAAEDDSTRIVGRVTSVSLDEGGSARFEAAIADTPHGRTIASLLDTTDGQPPFLKGVSIRGAWLGRVRRVRGPDGDPVETADDLELDGLDYTRKPGVTGARVDAFAWAAGGATETTERVAIYESVQEARVTITEETAPAPPAVPEGVGDALRAAFAEPAHILANGECRTCAALGESATPPMSKRGSGLSGTGGPYADPGYQSDKKQRYQLDTKAHAKAAWSFINKGDNAKAYTGPQLRNVKARILKALKKFGVSVAAESGWTTGEPYQVSEAVREWLGDAVAADPDRSGSWCITAANGPVSLTLSSYCMDPADLGVILRAAADAACKALHALDPDMDGDVDVPGVGDGSDTDGDAPDESAPPEQVTETSPPDPAPEPDAAAPTSKEGSAVSETTTQEAAPAPVAAPDLNAIQEAAAAAAAAVLAQAGEARRARKAAKKAAKPAEAAPAAPVTETAEQRAARLQQIAKEQIAAALAADSPPAAVQESDEDMIKRLVAEGLTAAKQELVASGQVTPGRKGLVSEHTARVTSDGEMPPAPPGKSWDEMHKWSTEELNQYATPQIADYVFRGRAKTG